MLGTLPDNKVLWPGFDCLLESPSAEIYARISGLCCHENASRFTFTERVGSGENTPTNSQVGFALLKVFKITTLLVLVSLYRPDGQNTPQSSARSIRVTTDKKILHETSN